MMSKSEQKRINAVNKFNEWLRKHFSNDREFDQYSYTRLKDIAKEDSTTVHLAYKEHRRGFWKKVQK